MTGKRCPDCREWFPPGAGPNGLQTHNCPGKQQAAGVEDIASLDFRDQALALGRRAIRFVDLLTGADEAARDLSMGTLEGIAAVIRSLAEAGEKLPKEGKNELEEFKKWAQMEVEGGAGEAPLVGPGPAAGQLDPVVVVPPEDPGDGEGPEPPDESGGGVPPALVRYE